MSKLLAEWFWTDRWMGSSAFLLPQEARGVYREMLTQAWRRGAWLPNNHEAIRRATGTTAEEWARSWPLIEGYWREDNGRLVNDTQLEVYAEAVGVSQRASRRGLAGVKARTLSKGQAPTQVMLECEPPSPSPKDQERESTRARFERWWDGYPKKVGKDAAWTEFSRLAPDDHLTDTLIAAVSEQRASEQWLQDNGRYIPHPRTWLHQGRWQDQVDVSPPEIHVDADWFTECKQIHAGACGLDRFRHFTRKRMEGAA